MPGITLELPGALMRRVTEKQARMQDDLGRMRDEPSRNRDDTTVPTGIAMRLDGLNKGLPIGSAASAKFA